ncbi:MAG TPA: hypothetical protein EYP08_08005 [Pyrodictiaceae archaeon]|nr:hypothetical protein [Pyrodictiaceae archaeon]HIQ55754.1 hypothetical protein [Pyrodictium sp.]
MAITVSSSQPGGKKPLDFLRQIVNPILAKYSVRLPRQVIDDVRKSIGRAEDRYKFSSYGGDIVKLADYLRSRDFDEVISIVKSADAMNILVEILETARDAYKEYPEVVKAVEERIEELKGKTTKEEERIDAALNVLKALEELGIAVKKKNNAIELVYQPYFEGKVTYDKNKKLFVLEYKLAGKLAAESAGTIYDIVKTTINFVKKQLV